MVELFLINMTLFLSILLDNFFVKTKIDTSIFKFRLSWSLHCFCALHSPRLWRFTYYWPCNVVFRDVTCRSSVLPLQSQENLLSYICSAETRGLGSDSNLLIQLFFISFFCFNLPLPRYVQESPVVMFMCLHVCLWVYIAHIYFLSLLIKRISDNSKPIHCISLLQIIFTRGKVVHKSWKAELQVSEKGNLPFFIITLPNRLLIYVML